MKRIISVSMAMLLVIALAVTAFAGSSFSMSSSASSVERGSTFTVNVSVSSSEPATTYGLKLSYDASVFELVSGSCTASGTFFSDFDNGFAFMFQDATTYSGSVGTATFKVKSTAPVGTYTISGAASVKNGSTAVSAGGSSVSIKVVIAPCATHSYGAYTGSEPTCTADGVKTATCSVCGHVDTKTTTALGHSYGSWSKQDNTNHVRTCSKCGTSDVKAHSWGSGQVTTAATCNKEGLRTYTCSDCSATKTETIAATGNHSYTWTTVDSTNHRGTCSVCSTTTTAAHTWDAGKVTTEATCSKTGVKTYTCSGCSTTKTETVAANGNHTYSNWTKVDDTNHKGTCTCGATSTVAHTWDSGKITTEASCGKTGVKTYTCTGCNGTKTEAVEATDSHVYTNWTKVDDNNHKGTCTCGETTTKAHTFDEGKITKEATCSTPGEKTFTCTECKGTKTEETETNEDHVVVNWTDAGEDRHEGTCECGEIISGEHVWDEGVETKEGTCMIPSEMTYTCTECAGTKIGEGKTNENHDYSDSYKDNGDSNHTVYCVCGQGKIEAHDFATEGAVTKEPTSTEEGKQELLCACGAKTEKSLEKLPEAPVEEVPQKTGNKTVMFVALGVGVAAVVAAGAVFVIKRKSAK